MVDYSSHFKKCDKAIVKKWGAINGAPYFCWRTKSDNMNDALKISFIEGDLKNIKITVPNECDMAGKKAKVQIRKEPGSPVVLEFSTDDTEGWFVKTTEITPAVPAVDGEGGNPGTPAVPASTKQVILWVIPGYISVGKSGTFYWEIIIFSNEIDPARYARGVFEIQPQIAKL